MRKEYVFQCNCHAFHFMQFEWYTEDHTPFLGVEGYLAVGGDYRKTFLTRVKNAWRILSGRNAHTADIILDRGKVIELRNALELFLWDAGYEAPPPHFCIPGCSHPERVDLPVITEAALKRFVPLTAETKLCSCCYGRWNNCSECQGNCSSCDRGTVEA